MSLRGFRCRVDQQLSERWNAFACLARGSDDGAGRQRRGGERRFDFAFNRCNPVGGDPIDFGDDRDGSADAQEIEYGQMLGRLWHGTVVGCDHKQGKVHHRNTRKHVMDESDVTGYIDEAERGIVRLGIGETKVNGQSPRFFL